MGEGRSVGAAGDVVVVSKLSRLALLAGIVKATDETRGQLQADLDSLVNWANIANDEGDFGASLQLGLDVFNHDMLFARLAGRTLTTAYELLDRHEFAEIAAAHAKQRTQQHT